MVVLGIWVVELGYAIAYAGWCSWNGGKMSILDAFTGKGSCGANALAQIQPSGGPASNPAVTGGSAASSGLNAVAQGAAVIGQNVNALPGWGV